MRKTIEMSQEAVENFHDTIDSLRIQRHSLREDNERLRVMLVGVTTVLVSGIVAFALLG